MAEPLRITRTISPSRTYSIRDDRIQGRIDGIEALKQAALNIATTERYAYAVYDRNYGIELQRYIGQPYALLETGIEETLRDAWLQDDRFTNVFVTSVEPIESDGALVSVNLHTILGIIPIQMEVALRA